jgi:methyl-accepting chemotaxis protein
VNLNKIKIGPRLGLAFGSLTLLTVVVSALAWMQLERVNDGNDKLAEILQRATLAERWRGDVELNMSRSLAISLSGGMKELQDHLGPQMKATSEGITKVQEDLTARVDTERGKAFMAAIAAQREIYVAKRREVLELIKAGDKAAAQAALEPMMATGKTYLGAIEAMTRYQHERAVESQAAIGTTIQRSEQTLAGLALLGVLLAAGFGVAITRSVTRPLARSVAAVERIGQGDLTQPVVAEGRDEVAGMQQALQRTQESLRRLVGEVRSGSDSIVTAGSQIASGSADLSQRTEQTAGSLQQAASSLEQITGTVSQTADSARTANQLAASASQAARRGGEVVAQVVATMDDINASSKRIADIIGTIDGIAFQTNILALNAAVEAARAGEQGRGFAVVAGEVRSLAQRSAEAAREIKGLIGSSVEKVESGTRLVADAGTTMTEIVGGVQRVTDVIGEISAATSEQTSGLRQVNEAVAQLDQMTQQNAALVEESAAAAESLSEQSRRLAAAVAGFRVAGGTEAPIPAAPPAASPARAAATPRALAQRTVAQARHSAPSPARAAPAAAAAPAPTPAPTPAAAAAGAGKDDDWTSF